MLEHVSARRADAVEAELLALVAAGDTGAPLRRLYDRYERRLYGFGLRLLGEPGLAEELVQETWLRVWRSAARFDPERGTVRAFLFTIARRVAVDLWRRPSSRVLGAELPDAVAVEARADEVLLAVTVRDAMTRSRRPTARCSSSSTTKTSSSRRSPRGWTSRSARSRRACTTRCAPCAGRSRSVAGMAEHDALAELVRLAHAAASRSPPGSRDRVLGAHRPAAAPGAAAAWLLVPARPWRPPRRCCVAAPSAAATRAHGLRGAAPGQRDRRDDGRGRG